MTSFTPSPQQIDAQNAMLTGKPVTLESGAGTGKTSTFSLLGNTAADYGVKGGYITFNKKMAEDAEGAFPRGNIQTSTIHALARRATLMNPHTRPLVEKLGSDAVVPRYQFARHLRFAKSMNYTSYPARTRREAGLYAEDTHLSSNDLVKDGLAALDRWCRSDRDSIGVADVPRPETMPEDVWAEEYVPLVIEAALLAWDTDILSPTGALPFGHGYYLKLASLMKPRLTEVLGIPPGSLLFFDEAQDAIPAVTSLLLSQTDMQLISVGDPSQAINRFAGGSGELPMPPGVIHLPLTTSWRFGEAIADEANRVLAMLGAAIRLNGNPKVESIIETYDPDGADIPDAEAVLVRTNAQLITEALAVASTGRKVAIAADVGLIRLIVDDVDRIDRGDSAVSRELRDFGSTEELRDYTFEQGGDSTIKTLVRIALREGTTTVRSALERTVDEEDADLLISTAHKSKGRQWSRVRLAMDPADIIPGHGGRDGEVYDGDGKLTATARDSLMLLYVSITRAQHTLLVPDTIAAALDDLEALMQSETPVAAL